MTSARVYLVDDNDAFRRSTAWLLEAAGLYVSDFAGGPALLGAFEKEAPPASKACIVSDVRMPQMSGLELLEELRSRQITLPVIFVTAHGDVPLAVEAMRRGARHFIEKPFEGDTLIGAVQLVLSEPSPSAPATAEGNAKLAKLTPRERQVLDLVVTGKLNKTIADVLGISIKTVELHRANMMSKLEVRNVPELVRLVLGHA